MSELDTKKGGFKSVSKLSLLMILAFVFGYYSNGLFGTSNNKGFEEKRETSQNYSYINPLLYVKADQELFPELDEIRDVLKKEMDSDIKAGKAERISAYFRDLNTGRWAGINTEELYQPGSIMKVAIAITYYKEKERDKNLLNKQIYYKHSSYDSQHYKPEKVLDEGYYSAERLIENMIKYSDNNAVDSLLKGMEDRVIETHKDLDIPLPPKDFSDFMSTRVFSRLFRVLYNATYLDREDSEKILGLLSEANFNNGLKKGIPNDLKLSHKFGEYTGLNQNGQAVYRELHDCGIIYYQDSPYFLCIMTRGNNFESLEKVIQKISLITYEYVRNTKN